MGILLALASAVVWGSGDFAGGRAARRADVFQVLALSAVSGIVLLVVCAGLWREALPARQSVAWAAAAGVTGAVGIAALYRGLALGSAATVAPTAAVITAAFPVIVGAMTRGLPSVWQSVGFLIAMAGIWLVARSGSDADRPASALRLAVVAGLGFGGFLVLVARVHADSVFLPLAVTRSVNFITALAILRARGVALPAPGGHPVALLAGALDTGGNVLFLLARQHTRVDIASVLSSFYPIATVALARLLLGEPVTRTQWIGAAACLIAVGLIST